MKVNNKITKGIVFCASLLLLNDTAYGFSQMISISPEKPSQNLNSSKGKVFSGSNPSLASLIHIGPTETGIIIQVKNGLLVDVLQQIANHTNIQFRIADQLRSERIDVNIQAPSWDSGIEGLLKDFSKVTVWDKYSKMENVLLLEANKWEPPAGPATNVHDNRVAGYRKAEGEKPNSGPSISNLKQLLQVQPGHSIPPRLFADQEIRRYLKSKGIHSPNDWKQIKKGSVVRQMAKRELIKLLYGQQTTSK